MKKFLASLAVIIICQQAQAFSVSSFIKRLANLIKQRETRQSKVFESLDLSEEDFLTADPVQNTRGISRPACR